MNVLFLDQFSEMGGAQHCLLDLIPSLAGEGWHAEAAIPGSGPLGDKLRRLGVQVSSIACGPYSAVAKSLLDVLRFAADLASQVRAIGARRNLDLIYVNGPRLMPAAALAHARTPVLFHAHSHVDDSLSAAILKWALRASKASVAACSGSVAKTLSPYASHIVSNGTADMGFRERVFETSGLRIAIIGRVSSEKGHIEFLQAARSLPSVKYVICGEGNVDAFKPLAHGLQVEFLGWRDDMPAVLAGIDLLIMPSRKEGQGRVMLEAFSAGVPVIAFASGGIPEAIDDGETGFLVRDFSAAALGAVLKRVVQNPALLRAVAANARRRWEERYQLTLYRTRLMELMRTTALARRAGSAAEPRQQRTEPLQSTERADSQAG